MSDDEIEKKNQFHKKKHQKEKIKLIQVDSTNSLLVI